MLKESGRFVEGSWLFLWSYPALASFLLSGFHPICMSITLKYGRVPQWPSSSHLPALPVLSFYLEDLLGCQDVAPTPARGLFGANYHCFLLLELFQLTVVMIANTGSHSNNIKGESLGLVLAASKEMASIPMLPFTDLSKKT